MTGRRSGNFSVHGRALAGLGVASAVGIAATALFQLVTIRGLGPEQYGLLAAFLAIVNVVSVGSGALRNSVAVATAAALTSQQTGVRARRLDPTLLEALVLGAACTVGILALAPFLGGTLSAQAALLVATAATALPYFLFSRAQGILQGLGDATSVAWWSTAAQAAQLLLAIVALLLGYGALGVLAMMLLTAVIGAAGSSAHARRSSVVPVEKPFSSTMMIVLLITVVSAWLTNADVVLVRAGADPTSAGAYSAASTLIKTTMLVPSILSLYLLPRFVARREDMTMTRLGVNVTLLLTLVTGLAVLGIAIVAAPLVVPVFGNGYEQSVVYLPWLAAAWIPWALAQAVIIRLTAATSRLTLALLLIIVPSQWLAGWVALPDIRGFIIVNGVIGTITFAVLLSIHLWTSRRRQQPPTAATTNH